MNNIPEGNGRQERIKEIATIHIKTEGTNSLELIINEFGNSPKAMDYFYKRSMAFLDENNTDYKVKKVIATMCVHVPEELIYALGGTPLRICKGSYTMDQVGAEFLPAKSCPLIKSTLGGIHLDNYPMGAEPLLIVNPTSCDQKKKIGEVETNSNVEIYSLELPPTKATEEALEYWQKSVIKLIGKLEKTLGKRLKKNNLKEAILKIKKAQEQFRRLHNLRKAEPVIWGKDVILLANSYFYNDIESWTRNLSQLNDELDERIKNKEYIVNKNAPRLVLTGSPSIFPNLKLPVMIEQSGGIIVADEFCSSTRLLYDSVAVDEWHLYDMVPALADRYIKPCTCPNFTPNDDRVRSLLDTVKEFNADGVIYQSFAGCHLYDMESKQIGKILEKNNIPMLFVETDYNPDDTGQLSTRIEAFVDSIKIKKLKNN